MYSKESYQSLLKLASEGGYQFSRFVDHEDTSSCCIFLRHDVDYSLDLAVELARVNASLNVSGTFFLLLRSQVYNLLSYRGLSRAREIQALNQRLAFHCALPPTIPDDDEDLARLVRSDFDLANRHIPDLEPVFSWHNPTFEVLSRSDDLHVPGLVNVYGERFTKKAKYISDSNMRYSVTEFEDILTREHHSGLHLLLHPLNWIAGGKNMNEVIAKTWQYVIREREGEFSLNHTYQRLFPQGMPADVLETFSREWLTAAMQKAE